MAHYGRSIVELADTISDPQAKSDFIRHLTEDVSVPGCKNMYAYAKEGVDSKPGIHVSADVDDVGHLNRIHGKQYGTRAVVQVGHAMTAAANKTGCAVYRDGDSYFVHAPTMSHAMLCLREAEGQLANSVPVAGSHKVSFSAGFGESRQEADGYLAQAKQHKNATYPAPGHGSHTIMGQVE